METIQQCIIRAGFQLPTNFYYRNKKTGEVMTEALIETGDKEDFMSLDAAIVAREKLMSYFDAVDQAINLYGNEFVFRHFALDFSVYYSSNGRRLLGFPYHRSFSKLYEMIKHCMDESKEGGYFFEYDNTLLNMHQHREHIYISYFQLIRPTSTTHESEQPRKSDEQMPPQPETIRFSNGEQGIPIIIFRTPARPFLNTFWHELFRTENFCRKVSKEYGVYQNIWTNRRLVPANIDQLILSQNQMSLFFEVHDAFELSTEGKYFSKPKQNLIVTGALKKGSLNPADEVVCLNSCYKEKFRCVVTVIEQPPVGNVSKANLEMVTINGDDRFALEISDKSKQDFESVFYICKM